MLTSKQRSKLKSIAANLSPVTQVGKDGITNHMVNSLSEALEAREIIKVNVLETADGDVGDIADNLAAALDAEVVIVIGRKVVLYRYSSRDHFAHIEL